MERKRVIRKAILIFGLCLFLGGCKKNVALKITTGLGKDEMLRVENLSCMEYEMKVFLMNQKSLYEKNYGTGIWSVPVGEESFDAYLIKELERFLFQLKTMVLMAKDRGILLTQEEEAVAVSAAREYMSLLSEEEKSYLAMTEEQAVKLFQEYRLAELLVSQLTSGLLLEVSDDEARMMEVYRISFPLEEEEKAKEILERVGEGESFLDLSESLRQGKETEVIGRQDLPDDWEKGVFALETGATSEIFRNEKELVLFYCVNHYLKEETLANKAVIQEQKKAEAFEKEKSQFLVGKASQKNEEKWESISFLSEEIPQTDGDFYQIYEKYFQKNNDRK